LRAGNGMRPDKKTITDEVWDDDRIRSFLASRPAQGNDHPDFGVLLNAYRGMRPDDFARFIGFYVGDRHDLNPRNENGQTFVEFIAPHRHAKAFIEILVQAGAQTTRS
jgi:hypothetical protein